MHVSGQAHAQADLLPGEIGSIAQWMRGLVDLKVSLDIVQEKNIPYLCWDLNSDSLIFQSIA